MNTANFEYVLMKELLSHKVWLSDGQIAKIKHLLKESYYSNSAILGLFKGDVPNQIEFIEEETVMKLTSTLSDSDVDNPQIFKSKTELIVSFHKIVTEKITINLINKFTYLINNENNKSFINREQIKEMLLEQMTLCITMMRDQIASIKDVDTINKFSSTIIQGMRSPNSQKRYLFIPLMISLINIAPDPGKANLKTTIHQFFSTADLISLKYVIKTLDNKICKEAINEFKNALLQPIINDPSVLDLLYPLADKETQIFWLKNLIDSHQFMTALNKIASLNYKFDFKDELLQSLLNKAKTISVNEKEDFYKAINAMRCGDDPALKVEFVSQIRDFLTQMGEPLQKIGYFALEEAKYLKDSYRRDITRGVIEFLKQLTPANSFQSYSIRSVLSNWSTLEQQSPVQKDFIDFLFDKLIKRSQNENPIRLGFEALEMIKPKYEEYGTYYDDIYEIMNKNIPQLKNELLNGLMKLKPSELSKKDKSYWEKVTQAYEHNKAV